MRAAGLWRRGRLVRMDREGALPDLCVACGAPAQGGRVARKLYWSPLGWRIGAFAAPLGLLAAALALDALMLLALFWPLVLVLMVAHVFVRKSLALELGACARHRQLRVALLGLSWAALAGLLGALALIERARALAEPALWLCAAALLALAFAQMLLGVQAVDLRRLDPAHAWLARTGARFRAGLPELPR